METNGWKTNSFERYLLRFTGLCQVEPSNGNSWGHQALGLFRCLTLSEQSQTFGWSCGTLSISPSFLVLPNCLSISPFLRSYDFLPLYRMLQLLCIGCTIISCWTLKTCWRMIRVITFIKRLNSKWLRSSW